MYIAYDIVSKHIGKVRAIYHNPVPEQIEMEPNGFYVESIPTADEKPGFMPNPMVKIDAMEIYYDYVAISEPPSEGKQIREEVDDLKQSVAELTILIATP